MIRHFQPIAIYLPQFHPIKENDEWWGKGFTEWTNVAKAKPLFRGHHQPKLPADHGFYDLRNAEIKIQQADLARSYGITGFAYYHYWFNGKRLLEQPFNEILHTGKPDFPFCLIWANESWSRRWLGQEIDVLINQSYSMQDDINHANFLSRAFADDRYIKKDGRPMFTIYRPADLPDVSHTIDIIKSIALKKNNHEPFLIASNSHFADNKFLLSQGFDAVLNFRPQLSVLPDAFNDSFLFKRLVRNITQHMVLSGSLKLYDYKKAIDRMASLEPETYDNIIPVVFPAWDNTARRGNKGIIIKNNSPEMFERELMRVRKKLEYSTKNLGFVFINAWNEWAEGNNLEPDQKFGMQYLEAVKRVFW